MKETNQKKDCDCGHHHNNDDKTDEYQLKICPTERYGDKLIKYLEKEFEKDSESK